MSTNHKRKLIALAIAAVAAIGAGGAYAATRSHGSTSSLGAFQAPGDANVASSAARDPMLGRQAFLADLASRLHVSQQQLLSAVKGALVDQLNAAVKAGRLTQAQANAIERRLQQGGLPPLFFGRPAAPRVGGLREALGAAAAYLGLNDLQLLQQLRSGSSLAQIARSRHKSVSGLEQAITSSIKSRLDQAVSAGRISSGQEQQMLSRLKQRLDQEISRSGPGLGYGHQDGQPPAPPGGALGPPAGPNGSPPDGAGGSSGSPPGAPPNGWPPY